MLRLFSSILTVPNSPRIACSGGNEEDKSDNPGSVVYKDKIRWYNCFSSKFLKKVIFQETSKVESGCKTISPTHTELFGTILLIDFSSIVNSLFHLNAEEFQTTLNSLISEVFTTVSDFHGDVIKIYSTTVIVYWPMPVNLATKENSKEILYTLSVLCAMTLKGLLSQLIKRKYLNPKVKDFLSCLHRDGANLFFGLGFGDMVLSTVGNDCHFGVMISGSALTQAQRCLAYSDYGDVCVSSNLVETNSIALFPHSPVTEGVVKITSTQVVLRGDFTNSTSNNSSTMHQKLSDESDYEYFELGNAITPVETWALCIKDHKDSRELISSIGHFYHNDFTRFLELAGVGSVKEDYSVTPSLKKLELFIPHQLTSLIKHGESPVYLVEQSHKIFATYRIFNSTQTQNIEPEDIQNIFFVLYSNLKNFGGELYQYYLDSKGFHATVFFTIQRGEDNDTECFNAIQSAFYFKRIFATLKLTFKAVVACSKTFGVLLGSDDRTEYCIFSPYFPVCKKIVNQAVDKSKSFLCISSEIFHAAKQKYCFYDGMKVKIDQYKQVTMFELDATSPEFALVSETIGRRTELNAFKKAISDFKTGTTGNKRQVHLLSGRSGTGRSHLLCKIYKSLEEEELNCSLAYRLSPKDIIQPYRVINKLCERIFSLDSISTKHESESNLYFNALGLFFQLHSTRMKFSLSDETGKSTSPALENTVVPIEIIRMADDKIHRYIPLLQEILPFQCLDNDFTKFVVGEARKRIAEDVILALLSYCCDELNMPILLDDIHWCDKESLCLLSRLTSTLQRGFVVCTFNADIPLNKKSFLGLEMQAINLMDVANSFLFGDNICTGIVEIFLTPEHCKLINDFEKSADVTSLLPFTKADIRQCFRVEPVQSIISKHSALVSSDEFITEIHTRSHGLASVVLAIVAELCLLIANKRIIDITRIQYSQEEIILKRMEKLNRVEQTLLSIGCVIGSSFTLEFLIDAARSYGHDFKPVEVLTSIKNLFDANFFVLLSDGKISDYDAHAVIGIKDSLTRNVIYECIGLHEKQDFHSHVGQLVLVKTVSSRFEHEDCIHTAAFHFALSNNILMKLSTLEKAGQDARQCINSYRLTYVYFEGLLQIATEEDVPSIFKLRRMKSVEKPVTSTSVSSDESAPVEQRRDSWTLNLFGQQSSKSMWIRDYDEIKSLTLHPAILAAIAHSEHERVMKVDTVRLAEKLYCWCGYMAEAQFHLGNTSLSHNLLITALRGLGVDVKRLRRTESTQNLLSKPIEWFKRISTLSTFKRQDKVPDILRFQLNFVNICLIRGHVTQARQILEGSKKYLDTKGIDENDVLEFYSVIGLLTTNYSGNDKLANYYRDLAANYYLRTSANSKSHSIKLFCDAASFANLGSFEKAELYALESHSICKQLQDYSLTNYTLSFAIWLHFFQYKVQWSNGSPLDSIILTSQAPVNGEISGGVLAVKNAVETQIMVNFLRGNLKTAIYMAEGALEKLKSSSAQGSSCASTTIILIFLKVHDMNSLLSETLPTDPRWNNQLIDLYHSINQVAPLICAREDIHPITGFFKFMIGYACCKYIEMTHVVFTKSLESESKNTSSKGGFLSALSARGLSTSSLNGGNVTPTNNGTITSSRSSRYSFRQNIPSHLHVNKVKDHLSNVTESLTMNSKLVPCLKMLSLILNIYQIRLLNQESNSSSLVLPLAKINKLIGSLKEDCGGCIYDNFHLANVYFYEQFTLLMAKYSHEVAMTSSASASLSGMTIKMPDFIHGNEIKYKELINTLSGNGSGMNVITTGVLTTQRTKSDLHSSIHPDEKVDDQVKPFV